MLPRGRCSRASSALDSRRVIVRARTLPEPTAGRGVMSRFRAEILGSCLWARCPWRGPSRDAAPVEQHRGTGEELPGGRDSGRRTARTSTEIVRRYRLATQTVADGVAPTLFRHGRAELAVTRGGSARLGLSSGSRRRTFTLPAAQAGAIKSLKARWMTRMARRRYPTVSSTTPSIGLELNPVVQWHV